MANMRFFFDNLIDYSDVVITAVSESADLPAVNLQHHHRKKVYRTGTSTADERITFDLRVAKAAQAAIILDHNFTGSDTGIKIQGNTSDSWGSPPVDVAFTYHAGVMIAILPAAQIYRYWSIPFTKSSAGETRDIGKPFIGTFYECTKNIAFKGLRITPVDLSETVKNPDGYGYSDIKEIYNEIRTKFTLIDDTQMEMFRDIGRAVGTRTPFFISIDPDVKPYDWLFYVKATRLAGPAPDIYKSASPKHSAEWEFEEQL